MKTKRNHFVWQYPNKAAAAFTLDDSGDFVSNKCELSRDSRNHEGEHDRRVDLLLTH